MTAAGMKRKHLNMLTMVAILGIACALGMVLFYAPNELIMGDVQRIFYFHVAAGWVGGLAFAVAAIYGGLYLWRLDEAFDDVSVAAVEIGLVFTIANIITGSIWARPIWNTWWTWDPRLITASIMAVIYTGYLLLRRALPPGESRQRISAGYALLGFLSVPITFFSIRLFRTIHPILFGSGLQGVDLAPMSGRILATLAVSLLAFTLLFLAFLAYRIRLARLQRRVEDWMWKQATQRGSGTNS